MAIDFTGVKILVVEDEPDLAELIKDDFEMHGATVWVAANGQQGLNVALENRPQILISDLHMASGGGREMLEKIRVNDAEFRPVVFFMSGSAELNSSSAKEIGAHGFISKPIKLGDIRTAIKDVLKIS